MCTETGYMSPLASKAVRTTDIDLYIHTYIHTRVVSKKIIKHKETKPKYSQIEIPVQACKVMDCINHMRHAVHTGVHRGGVSIPLPLLIHL